MLKSNYPCLSRREFLASAVGAGGAMMLGPSWLHAASDHIDPRVADVGGAVGKTGTIGDICCQNAAKFATSGPTG